MVKIVELKDITKERILEDDMTFRSVVLVDGVLGLRGINLSPDDFHQVMKAMHFSDGVHSYSPNENFEVRFNQMINSETTGGKVPEAGDFYYPGIDKPTRQTFMFWYMDDLDKEYTLRTCGINMHTFTAPPGTGAIGFVDMHEAWRDLPKKWKNNLRDAHKLEAQVSFLPDGNIQYPHPIVRRHWWHIGDHPILQMQGFNDDCDPPFYWDLDTIGDLTEEDTKEINSWVFNYCADPDNQHWWDWEEGDLVVYDAYRLSVAWSAGFGLNELVFDQIRHNGGYPLNTPPPRATEYVVPEGHEYHG